MSDPTRSTDPRLADLLVAEEARQASTLTLIASENHASGAVRAAMGSVLTNKYSEGYPGKRYYAGNSVVDQVETLALERVQALFGADHANVQPHSGSSANLAAYFATLAYGDSVLAMDLSAGGHLTHGSRVSATGKLYRFSHYGVGADGRLDFDLVAAAAREHRPKVIVCGASAYPRQIDFGAFAQIAQSVGAVLIADVAHIAGLIVTGEHPSPVGTAPIVTSSTHKTLRGPRGGLILCDAAWAEKIDKAVMPGLQGGPLDHVIAAKAVAFLEAKTPEFKRYQRAVVLNAQALAEALIAGGANLITGGTDNHLVLMDVTSWGTSGKEAEGLLEAAGVVANRNVIPGEQRKPTDPSGLRLGTPAITTRGVNAEECARLGSAIANALRERTDGSLRTLRDLARQLASAHPLPL